jgi:4-oxalocrotonate tautomerase family enzyme
VEQTKDLIQKITDAVTTVTSEKLRDVTWVIINQVKSGNWGVGGKALGAAGRQENHRQLRRKRQKRGQSKSLLQSFASAIDFIEYQRGGHWLLLSPSTERNTPAADAKV